MCVCVCVCVCVYMYICIYMYLCVCVRESVNNVEHTQTHSPNYVWAGAARQAYHADDIYPVRGIRSLLTLYQVSFVTMQLRSAW